MYDADYLPSSGQTALKNVEVAQAMRQKERTMDELKSILGRITFTLTTLKEAEKELKVSLTPDACIEVHDAFLEERLARRERIRKKIIKRKKQNLQKEEEERKLKAARKNLNSKQDTGSNKTTTENGQKDTEQPNAPAKTHTDKTHGQYLNSKQDTNNKETSNENGKKTNAPAPKHTDAQPEQPEKKNTEIDAQGVNDEDGVVGNGEIVENGDVEMEDDDWCSLDSEELDEYDSSDLNDISSDEDDQPTMQQLKPKSSIEVLVSLKILQMQSLA